MKKQLIIAADSVYGATKMTASVIGWIFKKPESILNIFKQMVRIGVDSLPIVLLASLFTGMVLALQSGIASEELFGQAIFLGILVAFSMTLELGPVLTAIVVAGRVGASIAAQLGSMKVTEQIDAIYTLGTTPEKYLITPLFISTIIMVPLITLLAILTGIFGGHIVATATFDIPSNVYISDIVTHLDIVHFVHGIIKSFFFAFIIVTVSCYNGLNTSGGAEGVGKSTTRAVVVSMLLILVSNYFLSLFLKMVGII